MNERTALINSLNGLLPEFLVVEGEGREAKKAVRENITGVSLVWGTPARWFLLEALEGLKIVHSLDLSKERQVEIGKQYLERAKQLKDDDFKRVKSLLKGTNLISHADAKEVYNLNNTSLRQAMKRCVIGYTYIEDRLFYYEPDVQRLAERKTK